MNAVQKVAELREQGYDVYISHARPVYGSNGSGIPEAVYTKRQAKELGKQLRPNGGVTTVSIRKGDDSPVWQGTSLCSTRDNFNRRLGLEIALGRALKKM